MKTLLLKLKASRILTFALTFGTLFFAAFATANAQTTTFAQFVERTGSQDFVFTNNASSADFSTVGGGAPIFFFYSNIASLDPSLAGLQNAHFFVTTTTTATALNNAGTLDQAFNQTVTVQIIRD